MKEREGRKRRRSRLSRVNLTIPFEVYLMLPRARTRARMRGVVDTAAVDGLFFRRRPEERSA